MPLQCQNSRWSQSVPREAPVGSATQLFFAMSDVRLDVTLRARFDARGRRSAIG